MGYIEEINETLVPRHTEEAVVLYLFAGLPAEASA